MRVRILQIIAALITIGTMVVLHDLLGAGIRALEPRFSTGLVIGGFGTMAACLALLLQDPAHTRGMSRSGRHQVYFLITTGVIGLFAFWYASADTIASGRLFVVGFAVGVAAVLVVVRSLILWDRRSLARREQQSARNLIDL